MVKKIFDKYIKLDVSLSEKIYICELYLLYKNILQSKNIKNECKFLNLSNLFFKKISNIKFTKEQLNRRMYENDIQTKLTTLTPLKFTNWLFSCK